MDIDEEEAAWDVVRNNINIDIESGEFIALKEKNVGNKETASTSIVEQPTGDEEQIEDFDNQQPGTSASTSQKIHKRSGSDRRTLGSLLGQANLEHARGRTKEAMAYLFEAIKLAPYHVQTYKELSDIYTELNQNEKSFEFKMLAALLTDKTTAEEWDTIAEMAKSFGRMELAVASLAKAIRRDSRNWQYYEKRIQILDSIGEIELAMKTRLQAAQSIDCQNSQINFAWIDKLIKTAADYFCTLKDEEKATEALETFILRSREFGRSIDFEHLALLGMWMSKGQFEASAKSILALHQNLIKALQEDDTPAIEISFTNAGYLLQPFPPDQPIHWLVDESLSNMFLSHLIICLVHLGHLQLTGDLIEQLLQRPVGQGEENIFLEIARSLHMTHQLDLAVGYIDQLRAARPEFNENAEFWFLHGFFHQLLGDTEIARKDYETVISMQPGHIDARINLSTILQNLGEGELALATLKDLNLDSCSQIPDERLLVRQAEVLLEQRKADQYISCLRMLLIPHFYVIHQLGEHIARPTRRKNDMHSTLKRCAFDAVRGSALERMVKKLGSMAHSSQRSLDELNANELHDYAFKLSESLFFAGEYAEMLHVVCYAFLHPTIVNLGSMSFYNLLFFASIKARNFAFAFEFLRFYMTYTLPKVVKGKSLTGTLLPKVQTECLGRVYIAMNLILCQHQSVNYHRFIMRQLVKQPESDALHVISGNNSLITGSYRHALGEYFSVWLHNKHNPLLVFLIALTFTHICCKKDISSRHMVGIRALAFMNKYAQLRASSLCQEIQYNMGRMFHQMGLLTNAVHCYERVLHECPTPMVWGEDADTGEVQAEPADSYDLRRHAAYNLALIYESNGNRLMARHILEEFCAI